MSMYLGWIHVRASLLVNYGLLYWAFISGLHVINKWKMYSIGKNILLLNREFKELVHEHLPLFIYLFIYLFVFRGP